MHVVIYSKYSQHSKRLIDKIENAPINLFQVMDLIPLCIDNESVRDRIQSDPTANLSVVPSILVVYPDGGVEKYEGDHSFSWIDSAIRARMPVQTMPQQVDYSEPIQPARQPQQPIQKQKPKKRPPIPPPKTPVHTPIEELEEPEDIPEIEEEFEEEELKEIARPPVTIRTGANNFEELDFPTPDEPVRAIKTSGLSLTEKAAMMQHGREADEQKHQRPVTPMTLN